MADVLVTKKDGSQITEIETANSIEDIQNQVSALGENWDDVSTVQAEDRDADIIGVNNGETFTYGDNRLSFWNPICVQSLWMVYAGENSKFIYTEGRSTNIITYQPNSSLLKINTIYNNATLNKIEFPITTPFPKENNQYTLDWELSGNMTFSITEWEHTNPYLWDTQGIFDNNDYIIQTCRGQLLYKGAAFRGFTFILKSVNEPDSDHPYGYCEVMLGLVGGNKTSETNYSINSGANAPTGSVIYYNGTTWTSEWANPSNTIITCQMEVLDKNRNNICISRPWALRVPFNSIYEYYYAKGLTDVYKNVTRQEMDNFLQSHPTDEQDGDLNE